MCVCGQEARSRFGARLMIITFSAPFGLFARTQTGSNELAGESFEDE